MKAGRPKEGIDRPRQAKKILVGLYPDDLRNIETLKEKTGLVGTDIVRLSLRQSARIALKHSGPEKMI